MKKRILALFLVTVLTFSLSACTEKEQAIEFSEPLIEQAVREDLKKPLGKITKDDLLGITEIDLAGYRFDPYLTGEFILRNVEDLVHFENVEVLNLECNYITDISPIENHTSLRELNLSGSNVDISKLKNLTNLKSLDVSNNQVGDLSSLENLTNLEYLNLSHNEVTDISTISSLNNLTEIDLSSNFIRDISPLGNLVNLKKLDLEENMVSDLTAVSKVNEVKNSFPENTIDINLATALPDGFTFEKMFELIEINGNKIPYPCNVEQFEALDEDISLKKSGDYLTDWYHFIYYKDNEETNDFIELNRLTKNVDNFMIHPDINEDNLNIKISGYETNQGKDITDYMLENFNKENKFLIYDESITCVFLEENMLMELRFYVNNNNLTGIIIKLEENYSHN